MPVIDPGIGEIRSAHIFIAVLALSFLTINSEHVAKLVI